MKPLSKFSRLAAQVLAGGALLAIFLAGSPSQAQAEALPTDLQATDPSSGKLLAAEPAPKKQDPAQGKEEPGPKGKDPCDDPPGSCYSMSLKSPGPDPTGCTSGSKCTFENKMCDLMGHKCKTVGAPGLCFCSCR